jgi:hypothetical protein
MRCRDRGYDNGSAAVTDPETGDDQDIVFVRLPPWITFTKPRVQMFHCLGGGKLKALGEAGFLVTNLSVSSSLMVPPERL